MIQPTLNDQDIESVTTLAENTASISDYSNNMNSFSLLYPNAAVPPSV